MYKKIRVAIVGCGGMGSGHAIAISTGTGIAEWNGIITGSVCNRSGLDTDLSKKLELAGVYDINPERKSWAREKGFFTYDSWEDVLEDDSVDAILIATPNHLHKEAAIEAMKAGKHVLCEKPVTPSSKDLIDIIYVSKETGKVFYPRQNRRWDEDYRIIKKIYDNKLVGNTFNIECRILGSRGIPGDWRGIKAYGGGMMLDWGVHFIDRILDMIPEKVKKVFCHCTYITNKEVDDGEKIHLTFESGLTVVLEIGTCHFLRAPLWVINGTNGTARIDNWNLSGKIMRLKDWSDKDTIPILAGSGLTKTMAPRLNGSVEELELPKVEYDHNELYSNFADVCNGVAEQIVTCEQALRCLRLMEAAMKSSDQGIVVDFE